MANRTLRRAPEQIASDANGIPASVASADGSEPERIAGIPNHDSGVDRSGRIDGSEPYIVGGVEYTAVNPEQLTGTGTDSGTDSGTRRRRRSDAGQSRGSRTGTKRATGAETIAPFITMAHNWASVLLKMPELMLDPSEVKQLDDAYAVFCKHHDVPVMTARRMSELQLIGALAMVYGPRFVAVTVRRKTERQMKRNLAAQIDSIPHN